VRTDIDGNPPRPYAIPPIGRPATSAQTTLPVPAPPVADTGCLTTTALSLSYRADGPHVGTARQSPAPPADVGAPPLPLLEDWEFPDPNPGDVQARTRSSRQIGAGALKTHRPTSNNENDMAGPLSMFDWHRAIQQHHAARGRRVAAFFSPDEPLDHRAPRRASCSINPRQKRTNAAHPSFRDVETSFQTPIKERPDRALSEGGGVRQVRFPTCWPKHLDEEGRPAPPPSTALGVELTELHPEASARVQSVSRSRALQEADQYATRFVPQVGVVPHRA